jgi:predicted secreted protein
MAVTGHEFVPPAEDEQPPLTGGAGSEVWTFRALESGQATIGMTYGRPWQRDVEPTWRFALTVVVTAETP